MLVVETLPLAVAIGYNHSGWAKFKIVNMCLRCPVAIVSHVLWSHISHCVPCPLVPYVSLCPMSCVPSDPCPLVPYVFVSHVLCALFPMSFGPICFCVPCPVCLVSHVLWSHMSCVSHVLCPMSCALYVYVQCAKYQ